MINIANGHGVPIGDFVYLKLQPHKQVTVRQGVQQKVSAKFYELARLHTS